MRSWRNTYNQYKNLFWKNYNYYKEKENVRNFVELILTSLAIVIFSVFALKPTANTIIEINKEIKAKKETLSKMDIKIKNLQKAQQILSQEESSLSLLDTSLPSKPDPEIVIRQIEAASNESEVEIRSISTKNIILAGNSNVGVDRTKIPENSSYFETSISIKGRYENLIKTIQTYENLLRILIFDQFNLQPEKDSEDDSNSETLNLNINAKALYFMESKEKEIKKNQENTKKEDMEMIDKEQ